ncbi:MAG: hypothetical protein CMN61_07425 [Sphingobium sp.]|nr:hypothetical protein [Sphingobium sp.]MBS48338.1 hypothetical protein [Sphingobium sp.]
MCLLFRSLADPRATDGRRDDMKIRFVQAVYICRPDFALAAKSRYSQLRYASNSASFYPLACGQHDKADSQHTRIDHDAVRCWADRRLMLELEQNISITDTGRGETQPDNPVHCVKLMRSQKIAVGAYIDLGAVHAVCQKAE